MAKISNVTNIEKVLSVGGMHTQTVKRSKGMTVVMCIVVAGGIACIVFLPWKYAIVALIAAIIITIACFTVYIKATDNKEVPNSGASVIRTGETSEYKYEFDEEGFTVSGKAEKAVKWTEIDSIRNIGGAYQIKVGEEHFTVKKQGFLGGNDKEFKALLDRNGITIK